jgi:hypothetical protein
MPKANGLARKTTYFEQIPVKVVEKIAITDPNLERGPAPSDLAVRPATAKE